MNRRLRYFFLTSLLLMAASCATYYQANYEFNKEFEKGDLDHAFKTLQKESSEAHGKKQFLYFVNNGLVLSMMGRYEESNAFFEKAFLFGEDYRTNYLYEVGSYLVNPTFSSYRGEDHEHLLLLYYKALNYLKMNKTDDALVEIRRLNIRLQQLSDRYKSRDKYEEDAFIHILMGITYEVDKDFNNAFIAYRNAFRVYRDDYKDMFGLEAPQQLKEDLLRTAWLSGLKDEFAAYKDSLQMPGYTVESRDGGELIFFWHDGLAPVKAEWGVDFVVSNQGGFIQFRNDQLGFSFPFSLEGYNDRQKNGLTNLEVFRVAFPKYIERAPYYSQAAIVVDGVSRPLQLAEDVSKIAFKCLQERMGLEFSKALIRVALKKAEEYEIKKEDRTLGSLVGIFNAMTEKADTRNWQTLPHSIYYCRIPLKEGQTTLTFSLNNPQGKATDHQFTYNVTKGQILFHTYTSLESNYPAYGSF